ncbi:MAG: cadherin repeat domain-containing protein [Algicola sp.]|nr:cadherin repeat domain-containing protein [Algicola sp.]
MPLLHNKSFKKTLLALSLIAGTTLLTGCGSGGSSTPEAPVNTAPVVSGDASPIAPENQTEVGTYTATDAQGDAITFSLDGADAALFAIDATGSLSFVTAPDFESGDVGPYTVQVQATDAGTLTGTFAVSVSVSDVVDPETNAVVQLSGSGTSQIALIDGQTQVVTSQLLIRQKSDYSINTYQSDIYHIGRYQIDTITKYNVANLTDYDWSHSTNVTEDIDSNPYSITFVSENKAYLIRYGSAKVWIVNPSAQQFEDFYLGELDLTEYVLPGNENGIPRASAAVINDGKLYIAIQRLTDSWAAAPAYIAVFDTATDDEIETNANADDTVKGIPLAGQNPLENSLISFNDKVYVTTQGGFGAGDFEFSRIEEISTTDYTVRPVLTAASVADNTRAFGATVIVSAEKGYFYTSGFDVNWNETSTLYEFNPTTGEVLTTDVGGNGTEIITFIALDKSNILWVSAVNDGTPGIDLIDTVTNTKVATRMLTGANPKAIRFID